MNVHHKTSTHEVITIGLLDGSFSELFKWSGETCISETSDMRIQHVFEISQEYQDKTKSIPKSISTLCDKISILEPNRIICWLSSYTMHPDFLLNHFINILRASRPTLQFECNIMTNVSPELALILFDMEDEETPESIYFRIVQLLEQIGWHQRSR